MCDDLSGLQSEIGYSFRQPELLERALTHSSFANESERAGDAGQPDNEQLEFLGDSVLGLVTSRVLVERFPEYHEGQLSKLRAHLVSARHLAEVAAAMDLGRYLRLGRGEERSGGRQKSALLVNALEALLAAVYLDGGLEAAHRIVEQRILAQELERLAADEQAAGQALTDFKSALQEALQAEGRPQPSYNVVEERGPEHRKTFTVEVELAPRGSRPQFVARAEGTTKKMAEQQAARAALEFLRGRDARQQEPTSKDQG